MKRFGVLLLMLTFLLTASAQYKVYGHLRTELDGCQCSLCEQCLDEFVGKRAYMWRRVHTGARLSAKGCHSVVAGYLTGVVVKTAEVVCVDHQANGVLCSYSRNRSDDLEVPAQFLVLTYNLLYSHIAFCYLLVELTDEMLAAHGHEAADVRFILRQFLLS